jgi:osmoprotectant transport system permease protein
MTYLQRVDEQLQLLPGYLAHHVLLTLAALLTSILLCVPLGMLAVRVPRLRTLILSVAGVLQTIPGIALLALMVVLLGQIGFLPAFIALVLYSMLPVVRNTVTGLSEVAPAVIESAQACGMTEGQVLWKVRLPIALPVIMAGVRTSAVWIVGTATLSTPVGATSLGNFIFSGLQTQNSSAVLLGCLSAAALAIALDLGISAVEWAHRRRSWVSKTLTLVVLGAGVLASLSPFLSVGSPEQKHHVIIGAKTFTEQYILAEALGLHLSGQGLSAEPRPGMGSTVLFESLASGAVDCYVDYSGTLWTNILGRSDRPARSEVVSILKRELRERFGLELVGPLGFANAYVLAMPREKAERLGVRSLRDLRRVAPGLRMGSDYEFYGRPEWRSVRDAYGLAFRELLTFDPTLMYVAVGEGRVDVISAYSTDGRILLQDLVILDDPDEAFPPYDAVLLCSADAARRADLLSALTALVGTITDDAMRKANKLVDIDGRSTREAAVYLLGTIPDERLSQENAGRRGKPQ